MSAGCDHARGQAPAPEREAGVFLWEKLGAAEMIQNLESSAHGQWELNMQRIAQN
jgi:hypothetical protein